MSVPLTGGVPVLVPRRGLILALVLIAQFMVILDATIVSVALPSIQRRLGFSSELSLQWVINAYSLAFGGFLLLGGRAGDLFGRQRLFIAGVTLFSAASRLDGLASSPGVLIAGRAVQGLGGALTSPAVLAIIVATFTDNASRTKALGVFSGVTGVGSAAGLLLGGVPTQELSWRWIFLVNVPVGVIAALLALRFIPHDAGSGAWRRLDLPGAVSVTCAVTVLIYALVNAQQWGWGSGRFIGLLITAAGLVAVFLVVETRSAEPLVRLGIFRLRTLSAANVTMALMLASSMSTLFFPTLFMQEVFGYGPIKTGFAYVVWPAMMMVTATAAQRLQPHVDARVLLVAGLGLISGGLFAFNGMTPGGGYASDMLPGLLLTAAGSGLTFSTLYLLATYGVPWEESGLASGLINTSQQVGAAIGIAVLSTLAASRTAGYLTSHPGRAAAQGAALGAGFSRAFVIAGFIAVAAALVAVIAVPRIRVAAIDPDWQAAEATGGASPDGADAAAGLLSE